MTECQQCMMKQKTKGDYINEGDYINLTHIVPHREFDRIGGTSSATFPNFKYVPPREICVERNCFISPITK